MRVSLNSPHRPFRRGRVRLGAAVVLATLLATLSPRIATAAGVWTVCLDQADWEPYILFRDGQAAGTHVALMRSAAADVGVTLEFRAAPWVRCLLQAELGEVDAIASLVFNGARGELFEFPPEASRSPSPYAIDEIDDVVVTLRDGGYEFDGDLASLPAPVRVPRGWAIGPFLSQQGVTVDDGAPTDRANLLKLLRDRRGTVVATRQSAERELASKTFATLSISQRPIRTLSYFVAFSRRSENAVPVRQAFWQALARRRGVSTMAPDPADVGEGGEDGVDSSERAGP